MMRNACRVEILYDSQGMFACVVRVRLALLYLLMMRLHCSHDTSHSLPVKDKIEMNRTIFLLSGAGVFWCAVVSSRGHKVNRRSPCFVGELTVLVFKFQHSCVPSWMTVSWRKAS